MQWLWRWGGEYFGYRDGENLWTHDGRHVGKFKGNDVYGTDGRYLGELVNDRLICNTSKISLRSNSFAPYARCVGYVPFVNYVGFVMYAGHEDFPAPEKL